MFTFTKVALSLQRWISTICSFHTVQFCHQQYCLSAIFIYVNMVQTERFQTKEVIINNRQWLLGYSTNYFTNFCSQVPKHVSSKKKKLLLL